MLNNQRRMSRNGARRKRFSPLMLIGISIPVILALIATTVVFVLPRITSHAAADNMNCSLIVPPNPLTAQGLATPYQLVATDPAQGPCNEANNTQSAFVQGAVFDPATGQISIYNPLVIDKGSQPAAAPVVPQLPANAIVALWFGFQGNTLTLQDNNGSLQQGNCINGLNGSLFGQFTYCNAPAFFAAANQAIQKGQLKVPPLGTGKDGQPCPTVRDFTVVDMDQSDNVDTQYIVMNNGTIAQNTAANMKNLQGGMKRSNGSDNALVDFLLDAALGCTPWMAPDLADPGNMVPALPLNELQAAAMQQNPVAIVPAGDPMVLNNNNVDLNKVTLYRSGVDQIPATAANADTKTYCQNYLNLAPARLKLDMPFTQQAPTADPAAATNLFTFLAQRFNASFGANGLNCAGLLNMQSPITLTTDGNGVTTAATINVNTGTGGNGGNGGNGNTTPINCVVNGQKIANCNGTTTINNQSCTFMFVNGNINVVCTPGQGTNPTPVATPPVGTTPTPVATPPVGTTPTPVVPPTQTAWRNNIGISKDTNTFLANYDGWGNSYSAQGLKAAGVTPGKTLNINGVTFMWPNMQIGAPDNFLARHQTIQVTPVQNATTLAFLGSATNGPTQGTITLTYTNGMKQTVHMGFSDWTLDGGNAQPTFNNSIAITTPYRNRSFSKEFVNTYVFYVAVPLQQGLTLQSVTLPSYSPNQGQIHVFAIGTK